MVRTSLAALCLAVVAACGGDGGGTIGTDPSSGAPGGWTGSSPSGSTTSPSSGPGSTQSSSEKVFQPAFHQALRFSMNTGGLVTFRMKVPVHRSGQRVRVTFRSGDGSLTLQKATVAKAGAAGALASAPVALTFNGQPGGSVGARTRLLSDPANLAVNAGDELAVSFEVNGSLAASTIANFPGSYVRSGSYSSETSLGGTEHPRAVGVFTVDVEGPKGRAAVAIGDSITEGYVQGPTTGGTAVSSGYLRATDDYRNAWNAVASKMLGGPVVNAGVSGQGTWDAQQNLPEEVLSLDGITDCVFLLGTNDLGGGSVTQIEGRLQQMFDDLAPFCRVWAATLLPKERTSAGSLTQVIADRHALNTWLRTQAKVYKVIDFEAATQASGNIDQFAPGFGADGIHPSVAGQNALGQSAAKALVEDPN